MFCVKPLKTFSGKCEVCDMTLMSGGLDKSVFDANTFLLTKSEEIGKRRYVYIAGDMICSSLTNGNFYICFSNIGIF